ncbi:MAG: dockerin type I domain-containing protein [Clostridia bacterium]|nr:dockerin type I domain-containing protein [Clostridia bacterium]
MRRLISLFAALLLVFPLGFATADTNRLLGDCNGDGAVSAQDAAIILRHVVRLESLAGVDWYAADIDGDEILSASDASSILRYVVRLNQELGGYMPDPPAMISELRFARHESTLIPGDTEALAFSYTANGATPQFRLSNSLPSVASAYISGNSVFVTARSSGETVLTLTDEISHYSASVLIAVEVFDEELFELILTGLYGADSEPSEREMELARSIYDYVVNLDPGLPSTKVILEGLKLMGTPYSELDCSNFTRTAYANAGYGNVICAGSDNQIEKFRNAGCLYEFPDLGGYYNCSVAKPGYIFLWVDKNGRGNHSAIYLGNINGQDWLLESTTSAGGVDIDTLWTSSTWSLRYYANPLGN